MLVPQATKQLCLRTNLNSRAGMRYALAVYGSDNFHMMLQLLSKCGCISQVVCLAVVSVLRMVTQCSRCCNDLLLVSYQVHITELRMQASTETAHGAMGPCVSATFVTIKV